MIMKSLNTKVLTTYALFLAIMLIMAFVPGLGFIPTSVAAIVIIQVPVIIASYFLGFKGGMFFGLVFGLTSVIKCFTEPDAFAMIIMNAGGLKTVGLMIICLIVPRIMIGVMSRAVYTLFNKFDKTRISSMAVAAFVGTITNTILFLGAFYLFAKDACMAQFGAATADALFKMMLGVVTLNGIIEAVTSVIICTAVGGEAHPAVPCALSGPFVCLLPARLSASRALCKVRTDVISASTVSLTVYIDEDTTSVGKCQ